MPIILNKRDGSTVLTINNFSNISIDANTGSELFPDLAGSEKDAILVHFLGPTMTISFEYTLVDEGSTVVSGTGGTVTMARDQMAYLYNTLMSVGDAALTDEYTLSLEYSTTALDSGTASAGADTTLTDGGKSWTVNAYTNKVLKLTGGTGSGQVRNVSSNTSTVLTVDTEWETNPDNTSTYQIIDGFSRRGKLGKITCNMASDQPLTFRGNITFQVGKVQQ
jgi:hypothetical protein